MRRNVIFLVASVVIVLAALVATLVSGNTPVLGLDLRGGVSVVLSPVGQYKPEALDVAVDIIRSRVDSLGALEPEISKQGSDIVVDLPGVKDRCKAERLVGQTAELRFRPVLIAGVPPVKSPTTTTTTGAPGASTTTTTTYHADHHACSRHHDDHPRSDQDRHERVRGGRGGKHRAVFEGRGGQRRDRILRPERGRRASEDPHDLT